MAHFYCYGVVAGIDWGEGTVHSAPPYQTKNEQHTLPSYYSPFPSISVAPEQHSDD